MDLELELWALPERNVESLRASLLVSKLGEIAPLGLPFNGFLQVFLACTSLVQDLLSYVVKATYEIIFLNYKASSLKHLYFSGFVDDSQVICKPTKQVPS